MVMVMVIVYRKISIQKVKYVGLYFDDESTWVMGMGHGSSEQLNIYIIRYF